MICSSSLDHIQLLSHQVLIPKFMVHLLNMVVGDNISNNLRDIPCFYEHPKSLPSGGIFLCTVKCVIQIHKAINIVGSRKESWPGVRRYVQSLFSATIPSIYYLSWEHQLTLTNILFIEQNSVLENIKYS